MKPEYTNHISSYLEGEMDDSQREAFEEACRQDVELRSALKTELQARMAIHEYAKKERKDFYSKPGYLEKPGVLSKTSKWSSYLRVAAFFSIICVFGLVVYRYVRTPGLEELYERNFQLYPVSMERSTGNATMMNTDSLWQLAGQAYQQGKWEVSAPLLQDLVEDDSFAARDLARLLLGNIALAQDNPESAIGVLQQIDRDNLALRYDVAWYLALAYLKQGNKKLAIEELKILEGSKEYKERAEKAREKLR